jgi:hypothetical protein
MAFFTVDVVGCREGKSKVLIPKRIHGTNAWFVYMYVSDREIEQVHVEY